MTAGALALLALALPGFLGGCSKDGKSTGPEPDPEKIDPPRPKRVASTLYGLIADEDGAPLEGVRVAAGEAFAITDADGLYWIEGAQVPEGRAVILASKEGYFEGARAEAPGAGGRTRLDLRLMKKEFSHALPADQGGKVEVKDGAAVAFRGGSFVTASGSAYSGEVEVAARYLDPDSDTFYDFFSGDNQGWGVDAEFASLVSLGVLRVDIRGKGGESLRLAKDRPATLIFPEVSTVEGPGRIPLWHFDADIGQWREEGEAVLEDGMYTGEVAHFSDWNLDYKGQRWDFCVEVTCGGKPVSGVKVRTFQKVGVSDSAGRLCFINVPADRPTNAVEVLASDNGGQAYLDQPFVVNVDREAEGRPGFTLELDSKCPGTVQGLAAGCSGEPAEALVTAKGESGFQFTATEGGRFHLSIPTDSGWVLDAVDKEGRTLSPPLALKPLAAGEVRDLGTVKICSTGAADFTDIALDSGVAVHGSGGIPGRGAYPGWGLSPDGSLLAYGTSDGWLTLVDVNSKNVRARMDDAMPRGAYVHVAFTRDNARMLVLAADSVAIWDISSDSRRRLSLIRPATLAEFSGDGEIVFVASRQGSTSRVVLYETGTGEVVDTLHPTNFQVLSDNDSHRIRLLPEDDAFAYMVGNTGNFRVWSLSGDTLIREIKTGVTTTLNYEVAFSPSGRTFSLGPDRFNVHFFDVRTGDKLGAFDVRDFGGENNGVNGPYSTPAGALSDARYFRQAAIASDEVIQVIDFRGGAVETVLPTPKVPSQVSWYMKVGHEGKVLATRVRHPTAAPRDIRDGFRIYGFD